LIHRYLYRQETMNIVSLVVWGGILSYGIQLSSTGIFLVGLEGIVLQVVPPLALLIPFGAFFLLPMARRYRSLESGRISRFPEAHAQAGRGVER